MNKISICILLCSILVYVNVSANTAYTPMRIMTAMQITADMGAGINLYNTMDAPTETAWGNPTTTLAMITAWKQKGFKTLRLPVTWNDHLGAAPDYTINPTWLARVEVIANYAFANDMYVIINAHHEDWYQPTSANALAGSDKLTKVWTQIANRFKDYSDYLIFETMNEPRVYNASDEWSGGNTASRAIINQFNLAAVNAIRNTGGNNPKRFIMTPTYGANGSSATINDLVIPNNDSLVIVSIHNYSPYSFALQVPGVSVWGTASEKSQLSAEMDLLYNKFIKNGRAVVLGEWGAENKNNTPALVTYYDYYLKAAKSRQIATVDWMFVFNRSTLIWGLPIVMDAIVDPFKPNYSAVTGLTVSSTINSVAIGKTVQLTATIAPLNATSQAIIWTSANLATATVNSTGLITGKTAGTVTISATAIGKSATYKVTVTTITDIKTAKETGILIYPNPVIDKLNIQFPGSPSQISLYSMDGKQLIARNTEDSQMEIDMTSFKSGIYILKVKQSGQEVTNKIVK